MSTQKSRQDRLMEKYALEDESEEVEEWQRSLVEGMVDRENQRLWALYTALDVSQREAKEIVEPDAETSQSTVSRVIRDKDDAVVHDEDALDLVGHVHEDDECHPDEWIDAYRQVLADAKVDLMALRRISSHEEQTPEWAARRFPELVGCHHHVAEQLPAEEQTADDSHLNRLDSVNTDRWK